jgi:hypothetical protein
VPCIATVIRLLEAETLTVTAVAGMGLYKQKQWMLATAKSTANKECQDQLDSNTATREVATSQTAMML